MEGTLELLRAFVLGEEPNYAKTTRQASVDTYNDFNKHLEVSRTAKEHSQSIIWLPLRRQHIGNVPEPDLSNEC